MSFRLLYPEDRENPRQIAHFVSYAQGWAEELGLHIEVDLDAFEKVCQDMVREFPHVDGIERASPFKKAAHFFVWCVNHRPIVSTFSADVMGADLANLPNHQNVLFAYQFAAACLHGARLYMQDQQTDQERVVVLENRIRISYHSLCDLVDTYGAIVPYLHFKPVCLLFEQMAYKVNPSAAYPEEF